MVDRNHDAEKPAEKKNGAALFRGAVIALMLVIIVILLLLLRRCAAAEEPAPADTDAGIPRSVAARLGQLEGKSEEEIQAELNRVIEEGMFNISINTDPVFSNGGAEGTLEIENVPGNRYSMRVEIRIDETGELVYDSGLIDPDYHVQRDTLTTALAAGDYPATATFYAYDPETLEEIGTVSSQITIHVLF